MPQQDNKAQQDNKELNEKLDKAAAELTAEADKRGVQVAAKLRFTEFGVVPYPVVLPKESDGAERPTDTNTSQGKD